MLNPLINVDIYNPLPTGGQQATIGIEPLLTSVKWSTALPGGYQGADFGIRSVDNPDALPLPQLPQDFQIPPLAHVVVSVGGFTCFEGRITQIQRLGGRISGFACQGYGLHGTKDNYYTSASLTTATAGTVLKAVLTQAAPLLLINPGAFGDTAISHAYNEFDGFFPNQVIDQLSKEGTGSGADAVPMDWAVWENRSASWVARTVPQQPDYIIDFDSGVQWDEDYTDLYGSVVVKYTPTSGVTATTLTSGGSGYTTATITASGGGGQGFTATVTISGGAVTAINVTNAGYGYSSAPSLAIAGDGTGAAATAIVGSATVTSTAAAQSPTIAGQYGLVRATIIQGGNQVASAATQFRDTQLAILSSPKVACQIHRTGRGLELPGGMTVDPWRVRAGQWVQVGDQALNIIIQSTYDPTSDTLDVQCQTYPRDFYRDFQALQRIAAAAVYGVSPTTGAKLR